MKMSKSTTINNRLKRIKGQLDGVITMIEDDKNCDTVIPQFLAVKGALSAAFESYIHDTIATCPSSNTESLKKLITTLIRK